MKKAKNRNKWGLQGDESPRTFAAENEKRVIMKTKNFIAMFAIAAIFMTACSKDDDKTQVEPEPEVVTAAASVAGTYNGELTLSVMGADQGTIDTSLEVTATGENTVSITVGVMDAMGSDLGPFAIEGVSVTATGETYELVADSVVVPDVPYGESTVKVTVSVEGDVDADKNLTATFNMILGAMPFPVVGYFTTIIE